MSKELDNKINEEKLQCSGCGWPMEFHGSNWFHIINSERKPWPAECGSSAGAISEKEAKVAEEPQIITSDTSVTVEWKGKRVVLHFDKEDEYAVFFGQDGCGTMVTCSCPPNGHVTIWPHW